MALTQKILKSLATVTFLCTFTSSVHAELVHRWNFNGNLNDQIGGKHAQILGNDTDPLTGGKAVLSEKSIRLAGGANTKAQYVDLGSDLFGDSTQVTIELWATPLSFNKWARIFNISAEGGIQESTADAFFMTWNRLGKPDTDMVEFSTADKKKSNEVPDTNAPYELEREYHIIITLDNYSENNTTVTWYSAPADAEELGFPKGSFESKIELSDFQDNFANLGRSTWGDMIANADYNEVRVYHSLLTSKERQASHKAGVNGIKVDIPEPRSWALVCGLVAVSITCLRRRLNH